MPGYKFFASAVAGGLALAWFSQHDPGALTQAASHSVHAATLAAASVHAAADGPDGAGGTRAQNIALGRQLAAARGWTGRQWSCEYTLWQGESSWLQTADTEDTGLTAPGSPFAYGIAQAYPAIKLPLAGRPALMGGSSDPRTQIVWGDDYIDHRYGTPCAALIFKRTHGNKGY